MYVGLHVKCRLFMSDVNGTLISSTDFLEKNSNIEFRENPCSGSQGFAYGRTDRHNKANSHFPRSPNSPKNWVSTKILCAAFVPSCMWY
jgi:hypothetical protein